MKSLMKSPQYFMMHQSIPVSISLTVFEMSYLERATNELSICSITFEALADTQSTTWNKIKTDFNIYSHLLDIRCCIMDAKCSKTRKGVVISQTHCLLCWVQYNSVITSVWIISPFRCCSHALHITVEVPPRPGRRTKVLPEPDQCDKVWRREENSTSSRHQEATRCHWIQSGWQLPMCSRLHEHWNYQRRLRRMISAKWSDEVETVKKQMLKM